MGKTKTAFVGTEKDKLTSEEKYKLKQQKKREEEERKKAAGKKTEAETATDESQETNDQTQAEGQPEEAKTIKAKKTSKTKSAKGKTRSRRYQEVYALVDKNKLYSPKNAVDLAQKTANTKFDGTIELHLVVKKEGTTATVALPHSTGQSKTVEFADENTIKKLQKGVVDFDILLATADMMPKLVPFARLLGPKGLMPNPKTGTLVKDKAATKNFSADELHLKTEKKAPLMHTVIGKASMESAKLTENLQAILEAVGKNKLERAYLSSTMGPSIKLEI